MKKIKILTAFGTRPEVIKLSPLLKALAKDNDFVSRICATTQHREMQDNAMQSLAIAADHYLDIMKHNQDLFYISESILQKIPEVLAVEKPDYLVVQGDTTTALMVGLCGFYSKIPIIHIEAGLRTHNINDPYPEETNRQLLSRIATLHMAPTTIAVNNLAAEGVTSNVYNVGNTILDSLHNYGTLQTSNSKNILITVHRRENFGERIKDICLAIAELASIYSNYFFTWPVHPNPNIKEVVHKYLSTIKNINLCDPISYTQFSEMMSNSSMIISDSGGLQEEAYILGKKIIILRDATERPEVVTSGLGVLVGASREKIINAMQKFLDNSCVISDVRNAYGEPGVADRIVKIIKEHNNSARNKNGNCKIQ